jgi:hypothetical protein
MTLFLFRTTTVFHHCWVFLPSISRSPFTLPHTDAAFTPKHSLSMKRLFGPDAAHGGVFR